MQDTFRKIWSHGRTYTAGALAGKVAALFLLPLYTRYLTPSDFGVLTMLIITSELTAILLGIGFSSAMIRYWSKFDEQAEKDDVVSTALGFSLLITTIGIILAILFGPFIADLTLGGDEYLFALRLMFIATFFEINLMIPLDLLRVRQRSGAFVKVSLLRSIINMLLTIYLIAGLNYGFMGAVWANVSIGFLAALILMTYTIRRVGGLHISLEKLRPLLSYGLPFIPTGVAMYGLHNISRYFLRIYDGFDAVGIFNIGFMIAFLLSQLVAAPFSQVWGWLMFEVAKKPDAEKTIARVMTYFFAVGAFFALILSTLTRDLLLLIKADPAYLNAHYLVPLIALGYLFYGSEWVVSTPFFIKERTSLRAYIVLGAAIINVLLNAILVPLVSLQGAATAGAISFFIMFAVSMIVANRLIQIPWEIRKGLHILLISTILCVISLATINLLPYLWPGVFLRVAIAFSFPFLLLATGFFDREELQIFNRKKKKRIANSKPRALIISHHFPPDMQVAGQRPAKFAKYLSRMGWDVWVLTLPASCYPVIDEEAALDFLPADRIIRIAPWRKTVSSINDQAEAVRPSPFRSIKSWLAASIGMRLNEALWVPPASKAAKQIVKDNNIDIIFSSCFPFSCHILARKVQRATGRPWIADFHDPWADNPYIFGQAFWQRTLRRWLQKRTIVHAERITIVNEFMRDYFLQMAPYLPPSKVLAINHSIDPEDFSNLKNIASEITDRKMVMAYTGSLTSYRSPESLLDGLASALSDGRISRQNIELRFMGLDDMGNNISLQAMVESRDLQDVVKSYGTVSHKTALSQQLTADVLVYLQTQKGGGSIFASAKLYEYLAANRPIIALCEESMATQLLRSAGGDVIIEPDDIAGIAQAITTLYSKWKENRLASCFKPEVVEKLKEPGPTAELAELMAHLIDTKLPKSSTNANKEM